MVFVYAFLPLLDQFCYDTIFSAIFFFSKMVDLVNYGKSPLHGSTIYITLFFTVHNINSSTGEGVGMNPH